MLFPRANPCVDNISRRGSASYASVADAASRNKAGCSTHQKREAASVPTATISSQVHNVACFLLEKLKARFWTNWKINAEPIQGSNLGVAFCAASKNHREGSVSARDNLVEKIVPMSRFPTRIQTGHSDSACCGCRACVADRLACVSSAGDSFIEQPAEALRPSYRDLQAWLRGAVVTLLT